MSKKWARLSAILVAFTMILGAVASVPSVAFAEEGDTEESPVTIEANKDMEEEKGLESDDKEETPGEEEEEISGEEEEEIPGEEEEETPGEDEEETPGEEEPEEDEANEEKVDFMDVSSVYPGERINVKFKGKAKTKYAIKVVNPSGTANSDDELDELIISDEEGYVVWSYDVGPTTGAGKGKIVISEVGSKTVHTFDYIVEEGKQTEDREDKELILNLTAEATIKDPNSKDDDKDEKETEDIPAPIRPEDGTCKPCEKETVTTVVKPARPVVNHPTGNSTMGRAPQTGDGGLAFTASTMLLSAAAFLGTRKRR